MIHNNNISTYIREITIKNFLLCSKFSVAGNSVWNDNVELASTDLVQQRLLKKTLCMRKIKFNVSRNFLENIYMTFIRPLLENSCIYIYLLWNYPFTSGAPTAGVSVARLTTVIKMYIYYDKSTCNRNMIRHLPYIHTRYKLSINSP